MASRMLGLDVGTNAVRAVEVSLRRSGPVVERMGQVSLPIGAVQGGEVIDVGAVSAALKRLWREAGFTTKSVVVGVANQRVVARMTEVPALPEDELRSSLRYQVQDLIPIPVDDAQLDFQVIERLPGADGEQDRLRILLVAAHHEMLRSLLAALAGANLTANRIDLVPFALIRALHDPIAWLDDDRLIGGEEVIVAVGAGVTNVVVHDNGVPRFVRTLPTGGAEVTSAFASELGIDVDEAEGIKRGHVDGTATADLGRLGEISSAAIEPLVAEVVGSLDYHLGQGDDARLRHAVVTGGGARLEALTDRLADHLVVPVDRATPFRGASVGDVGMSSEVVAESGDLFTVAFGLALSGQSLAGEGRRITLLPSEVLARNAERRQSVLAGAGVAGVAAGLLALSLVRGAAVNAAVDDAEQAEQRVAALETQVGALREVETLQSDLATRGQMVAATLANDVAWPRLLQEIATLLPDDVWLESFSGSRDAGETPTEGGVGNFQVAAQGVDHTSTARWLIRIGGLPSVTGLWVPSSAKGNDEGLVSFSSDGALTPTAISERATRFVEVAR